MTQVSTRIVGAQHHEGAQTKLNTLRRGASVELRREPDNPHDLSAISCWKDGVMLGYIPRKDNRQAAEAMDRGEPVTCQISEFQPMVILRWPSAVALAEGAGMRRVVRGG